MQGTLADGRTCVLRIGKRQSTVEISGVGDFKAFVQQPNVPDRLVITLANGKLATVLYPAVKNYTSTITNSGSSYLQTLFSNLVLIGRTEFSDDDCISAIDFCPTSPFVSIFHRAHHAHSNLDPHTPVAPESLFSQRVWSGSVIVQAIDSERLEACSISLPDMNIALRATASSSSTIQGTEIEQSRRARLDFPQTTNLQRAIHEVTRLYRFFTMVVGEHISATDVKILACNKDALETEFDLHLNFPIPDKEIASQNAHRCLISIPFEGKRYGALLRQWFERADDWDVSYSLMYQAISERNRIGRDRYLNAIAWFESIPTFYLPSADRIDRDSIDQAAKAAASILNADGEIVTHERMKGLLSQLNQPSLGIRLRSAVSYLQDHFGDEAVPTSVTASISRIVSIRSGYAHGGNPETEYPLDEIYLGVTAAEYICCLLTLACGAWSFDLLDRAVGHPLRDARSWLRDVPMSSPTLAIPEAKD